MTGRPTSCTLITGQKSNVCGKPANGERTLNVCVCRYGVFFLEATYKWSYAHYHTEHRMRQSAERVTVQRVANGANTVINFSHNGARQAEAREASILGSCFRRRSMQITKQAARGPVTRKG